MKVEWVSELPAPIREKVEQWGTAYLSPGTDIEQYGEEAVREVAELEVKARERIAEFPVPAECSCSGCAKLCDVGGVPGIFTPDEAEAIVDAGGSKSLVPFDGSVSVFLPSRDGPDGEYDCGYEYIPAAALSPRYERTPIGGTIRPWGDRGKKGSACIFLVGGKCSIHEKKPTECRLAECASKPTASGTADLRTEILTLWLGRRGREVREKWSRELLKEAR